MSMRLPLLRGPMRGRGRGARGPAGGAGGQGGRLRWRLALVLASVALAAGGGWWWWQQGAAGTGRADAPAAAAAGAASGAAAGGARRPGPGARPQPISAGVVQRRDVVQTVQAIGLMAAPNTAVVRSRVDGELKALFVREGQWVKAGQLLAQLDDRAQQVALAQAQAQLARDQALLANAQLDLARYRDLLAKDAIAAQQVDTQAALVRQLQGTVQADEAAVEAAKLQLAYTRITAPISGRLGLKQADVGSTLRASDANGLFTIAQTQPMVLVFAVPEALLPPLRQQLQARSALPVQAWDRDWRSRLGEGRVSTLDNAIDPATGTVKLKAEFANADGSLFPNQFVNVRLTLAVQKDALAVPHTALQRGSQGAFVYVVQPDQRVSVRRVQPGAVDGDWVAVEGELEPGQQVVTDGADRLREGAAVEVIAPAKPREGPAGPKK